MDFLGPLPESDSGNKHLLVMADAFTKFVTAIPLPDQRATTVVDAVLNHFVSVHGVPEKLLTDQGPNFRATVANEIFRLLRVRRLWTSPYHPQTDGMVECWNRTVCKMLATLVDRRQKDWDRFAGLVTLAYNTSFHPAVQNTPYFLRFGTEPPSSLSTLAHDAPADISQHMAQVLQVLTDAHEDARRLIEDATVRRNEANDGKARRFKGLDEGDMVLLHVPRTPAGTTLKLGRPWRGPYKISKKHSAVNYTIVPLHGGPGKVIHVSRLKPFRGDPNRLDDGPADVLLGD